MNHYPLASTTQITHGSGGYVCIPATDGGYDRVLVVMEYSALHLLAEVEERHRSHQMSATLGEIDAEP